MSPIHVVPKQSGLTVVKNKDDELVSTHVQSGWRVCIDYCKLNAATRKDHFPFPFIDQMVERLAGHEYYHFLDGYSGYNQVPVDPEDQEKMTFTCPFGTFSYRRMPFRLCNHCMCYFSAVHDQHILRHGRAVLGDFYGRLLYLWFIFRGVSILSHVGLGEK